MHFSYIYAPEDSTLTYVSQANKVKDINHSQSGWVEISRQM